MALSLAKVLVVADGPGVMLHTAPLLLALSGAGYDASVAVSASAGIFATPFSPSMLTGHAAVAWPPTEEGALDDTKVILVAPCSSAFFRELAEGAAVRFPEKAKLLVAPAVLPADDVEETWLEFERMGRGRWAVIRPFGSRLELGALGELRTASPEQCVEAVKRSLIRQTMAGKRVLVTAGPTAEDADPVRYVTNRSTGRMGVALACAAARRGAEVTLVHGPMSWPVPNVPNIIPVPVRSASQMHEAVMAKVMAQDVAILCAAVADYTPVTYSDVKIKKGHEATFGLLLKRTPDILASVGKLPNRPFLVGFAAESDHVEANAQGKLTGKNCDMICANDVTEAGSGFAVGTNRVTVFMRDGGIERLLQMSKDDVARKILVLIEIRLHGQDGS